VHDHVVAIVEEGARLERLERDAPGEGGEELGDARAAR
jgi:hypothetical protein